MEPAAKRRKIGNDLLGAMAKESLSDIDIVVGSDAARKTFKCHRIILSARCPYFAHVRFVSAFAILLLSLKIPHISSCFYFSSLRAECKMLRRTKCDSQIGAQTTLIHADCGSMAKTDQE
eukprot:TRINITY_DN12989_c0_g1_i1.p1 TRINITY_DN12989_c0_g1~~TRINITY_DN12989_c0_g1_i1.p1  ORF type:complete len:127 (-),score=19.30 TRINITY_DN12989_c0_g1_i1:78-437(-)